MRRYFQNFCQRMRARAGLPGLARRSVLADQYQARLTAIASSLRDGILVVSREGVIEYANPQFCRQFGVNLPPEALTGMSAGEVIRLILARYADPDSEGSRIVEHVQRGEPVLGEEVVLANGAVLLRDFIPFDHGNGRSGRLWHHRDISTLRETQRELAQANRILADLSATDGLTRLANRRRLDEVMAAHCSCAPDQRGLLAFLLIDIDHFKRYNDRYGHLAGDECLKAVAGTLAANLRHADDLAARYGGEEFAIVMRHTTRAEAAALAMHVRRSVAALALRHEDSPHGVVTISIGVAVQDMYGALPSGVATSGVPTPGAVAPDAPVPRAAGAGEDATHHLIGQADQALYRAKHGARNCVAFAPGSEAPD